MTSITGPIDIAVPEDPAEAEIFLMGVQACRSLVSHAYEGLSNAAVDESDELQKSMRGQALTTLFDMQQMLGAFEAAVRSEETAVQIARMN